MIASSVLSLSAPAPAWAQESGSVGVVGGAAQYDLGGVGTVPTVSFRGTTALDRTFVGEAAVGFLSYFSQGSDQINHLFPEAQLQAQWLRPGIRPYLGAGAGASVGWSDASERSESDLTLSAAGGARWPVVSGWVLQGELRVRSVDPWTGTTADWSLGVAGRF